MIGVFDLKERQDHFSWNLTQESNFRLIYKTKGLEIQLHFDQHKHTLEKLNKQFGKQKKKKSRRPTKKSMKNCNVKINKVQVWKLWLLSCSSLELETLELT